MNGVSAMDINARIATRVSRLRSERSLSLATLAERSGVSRSMISLIERGETSTTAVVLEKVAAGLNVPLASLFEAEAESPLARHADQPVWRDPASGYVRRNVSPGGGVSPIQIVEVMFPPTGHVTYEGPGRRQRIHHQVWVLEGAMEITVGEERYLLEAGDCLAFSLDRPTAYHNPTGAPARYAVVIVAE